MFCLKVSTFWATSVQEFLEAQIKARQAYTILFSFQAFPLSISDALSQFLGENVDLSKRKSAVCFLGLASSVGQIWQHSDKLPP